MRLFSTVPLRWRVFLATSITISVLFAIAGWGLQQYALSVADESARTEIRASIQSYEAVWKARTQVLSAVTSLMGAMSDVRAAFMTRDRQTIRDSAQELWSHVSDQSAIFLVLDPEGHLVSSLGDNSRRLSFADIPMSTLIARFPKQLTGYVRQGQQLFYVVLTPVYVQASGGSLLLNILCAGFRIDERVVGELKKLAPDSEFAFFNQNQVFATTLSASFNRKLSTDYSSALIGNSQRLWQNEFIIFRQHLDDVTGKPIAELRILHSYANVRASLSKLRRILALAWIVTVAAALLISSYTTRRLLAPIKLLDQAASEVAARNYRYRVPVKGSDELSRLAATFNNMCESIQRAQADFIRQEQIQTIGRLGTSLVHDLRNPLAAIYGGAEMLVDGQLPPEQMHRIAVNIHRASQRMQELLRDLLNVSRGEHRNQELCRLREIVEAAAESASSASTNIEISIDESSEVFADRTRVERVFSNLFSNALEAMPEQGKVFVHAERDAKSIRVFVRDTGPGVALALRNDVFRAFVTGKLSGSGLGLTLSRQTMVELGGDLVLVDDGGPGACFCACFPVPLEKQVVA